MNFGIGDRVVCVDNSTIGGLTSIGSLVIGRQYIIYDIRKSHCTNNVQINVGIVLPENEALSCKVCGKITSTPSEEAYFRSSRFKKVEEKKEVQYIKQEIEIEEPCYN